MGGQDTMMRCAECGKLWTDLGSHIKKHKMTADEYQAKHGVNPRWRLAPAKKTEEQVLMTQYMKERKYTPKGRYGK